MKITVEINEFKKTVAYLESILKGKYSLSILNCMYLKAENNVITAVANNLDMAVVMQMQGVVEAEGEGLIDVDDLNIICKLKQDVQIEFLQDGRVGSVQAERLFKFAVLNDAKDFPQPDDITDSKAVYSIPSQEMLHNLKLSKLMSKEPDKPVFNGIWIDNRYMLACNGFMLGKIETDCVASERFMIPLDVVSYLAKLLDKSESPLKFYLSDEGRTKIYADNFILHYRWDKKLQFLNHESMFNTEQANIVELPKDHIKQAISFIRDVSKASMKGVKGHAGQVVYYDFKNLNLTLRLLANTKTVVEEIVVKTMDAFNDISIAFDPNAMHEMLALIEGSQLSMSFYQPLSPSIMYGDSKKEMYLILPSRVKDAA